MPPSDPSSSSAPAWAWQVRYRDANGVPHKKHLRWGGRRPSVPSPARQHDAARGVTVDMAAASDTLPRVRGALALAPASRGRLRLE